ncbi:hypothetical protein FRB94_012318 [Tulasnella sp. JGI-2019a]|nr:hypothetical protein FRB94_012318 [Tulasnella sp. JGI-2019a]KAG9016426.1 hypothetical protein FRB93_010675 [Tulasnella sp. JGI-2019a]
MDRATAAIDRWRSLKYESILNLELDPRIHKLTKVSAPNLGKLTVVFRERVKIDLFGGKADRLRYVELHKLSVPWNSGMLSGLQTLILRDLGDSGPSEDEVINIIRASPALVKLSLGLSCGPSNSKSDLHAKVTELSALRVLVMDIDAMVAQRILTLIRIPQCTTFQLRSESNEQTGLFSSISTSGFVVHCIHTIMAAHPILGVRIQSTTIAVTCGKSDGLGLHIQITERPITSDLAEAFTRFLEKSGAVKVELIIAPDITLESVLPILRSGCNIKTLRLNESEAIEVTGPHAVMKFLAEPMVAEDGRHRWPLRRLGFLILEGDYSVEGALLAMVSRRYGEYQEDGRPGLAERPMPLRALYLDTAEGVTEDCVRQLAEILGDGVLSWGGPNGFEWEKWGFPRFEWLST